MKRYYVLFVVTIIMLISHGSIFSEDETFIEVAVGMWTSPESLIWMAPGVPVQAPMQKLDIQILCSSDCFAYIFLLPVNSSNLAVVWPLIDSKKIKKIKGNELTNITASADDFNFNASSNGRLYVLVTKDLPKRLHSALYEKENNRKKIENEIRSFFHKTSIFRDTNAQHLKLMTGTVRSGSIQPEGVLITGTTLWGGEYEWDSFTDP